MPIIVTVSIASAIAIRLVAVSSTDHVSPDETARRREALIAELPLKLSAVDNPAGVAASLGLPGDQRDALQAALLDGRLRLAWLPVFDSDAVDGDRVTVQSLGLSETLTLTHAPVPVAVAVPSDHRVRLIGVDQGHGGGVTVGVVSDGHAVKLPPMAVGQSVYLTIGVR